jgi:chromosome partitioning protein
MTVLAIACHKGGTAKTTSTATLAVALAQEGQRVLACDLDHQAALTTTFGIQADQGQRTVYHALLQEGIGLAQVIVPVGECLDLAPSHRDLAAGEVLMQQAGDDGDLYLREALAPLRDQYDYILMDCPPNLGKLTINALVSADRVIIPVNPSFLAVRALGQLLETIELVRARRNPSLAIMGILLTRVSRTLHAAEVEARLRQMFPDQVFSTAIGQSVRFEEAPVTGKTILDYEPWHPGALAYRAVAKEILNHA